MKKNTMKLVLIILCILNLYTYMFAAFFYGNDTYYEHNEDEPNQIYNGYFLFGWNHNAGDWQENEDGINKIPDEYDSEWDYIVNGDTSGTIFGRTDKNEGSLKFLFQTMLSFLYCGVFTSILMLVGVFLKNNCLIWLNFAVSCIQVAMIWIFNNETFSGLYYDVGGEAGLTLNVRVEYALLRVFIVTAILICKNQKHLKYLAENIKIWQTKLLFLLQIVITFFIFAFGHEYVSGHGWEKNVRLETLIRGVKEFGDYPSLITQWKVYIPWAGSFFADLLPLLLLIIISILLIVKTIHQWKKPVTVWMWGLYAAIAVLCASPVYTVSTRYNIYDGFDSYLTFFGVMFYIGILIALIMIQREKYARINEE